MYVHYDEETLRVTGITTFAPVDTIFTAPTLDILDVEITAPLNEYTVSLEDNKITYVGKSADIIAKDLADAKIRQKAIVKKDFTAAANSDVVFNEVYWYGGNESVTKLDGAKRLTEMAGLIEVTFFDASNTGHILSIEEANAVILTIGVKYQTDFAKKQTLYTNIENATTIEEVYTYIW